MIHVHLGFSENHCWADDLLSSLEFIKTEIFFSPSQMSKLISVCYIFIILALPVSSPSWVSSPRGETELRIQVEAIYEGYALKRNQ